MHTLSHFHHHINQNHNLDKQYKKWHYYRRSLFKNIKPYLSKDQNILIIGAGNCNDLYLEGFLKHSKAVTLLDIDYQSLYAGIWRQDLEPDDFHLLNFDMTGLEQIGFYESFQNLIKEYDSADLIYNQLKFLVEKADVLKDFTTHYDMIIVSSIYTQLVYGELFHQLNHQKKESRQLKKYIIRLLASIIKSFNQNLVNLTRKNGCIYAWSDMIAISNDTLKDHEDYEALYETYKNFYSLGIPHLAMSNLSKHLAIDRKDWHQWPFDEKNSYIVQSIIGHKK